MRYAFQERSDTDFHRVCIVKSRFKKFTKCTLVFYEIQTVIGLRGMNCVSGEESLSIIAVILAGGRSSRMGRSKALLSLGGQCLVDRTRAILENLRPSIERIVISGSVPETEGIGDFIPDRVPFRGPVMGIGSCAKQCLADGTGGLLVVPVDLPLLTADVLLPLVSYFKTCQPPAVFFDGNWLPALFRLDGELIRQCNQNLSVRGLLESLSAASIPITEVGPLTNTNTPEEWAKVTKENI